MKAAHLQEQKTTLVWSRREFLARSLQASLATVLTSRLALHARASETAAVGSSAAPLGPVAGYLACYRAPSAPWPAIGPAVFTFDKVGWLVNDHMPNVLDNPVIGHCTITRTPATAKETTYLIEEKLQKSIWRAELHCENDLWQTPRTWEVHYGPVPAGAVQGVSMDNSFSGRYDGMQVTLTVNGRERTFPCAKPLTADWTMLVAPAAWSAMAEAGTEFALLTGLFNCFPGQSLKRDGATDALAGARLQAFLQHGRGILPTHHLHDDVGRPLFTTIFLTSYALNGIGRPKGAAHEANA